MDSFENPQDNKLSIIKRKARLFSMLAMLIIVAAVPFTVYVAQQRQEIRQRAAWDGGWGTFPTGIEGQRCFPARGLNCPQGQTCQNGTCVAPSITTTPTITPTSLISQTLTPTGSVTPIISATSTPSIFPTLSISPTISSSVTPIVTSVPGGTQLAFELVLPGVGPNGGNQNPKKIKREIKVQVFDISNNEVANKSGEVIFDSATGTFKGTIDLGVLSSVLGQEDTTLAQWGGGWNSPTRHPTPSTQLPTSTPTPRPTSAVTSTPTPTPLPPGTQKGYVIKVKTKDYLRKVVNGVVTINIGTLNTMPITTLVVGDINDDNRLTIEDYNILVGCFGNKALTSSCTDKEAADLDDNDVIDGIDLNLLLRSLSVQEGD